MSWIFSKAMMEHCESLRCLQELGVESLEVTCLDGEPFAQLNVMPTPHKFWRNDKTMEFCDLSRFGLTLRLLTEDLGMELLTLYLAGFHVKTLVQPGKGQELMEKNQVYGQKWRASFAKLNPEKSGWKTHQCLLLGGLEEYSETWPKWGLMQDGECWELQDLGLTMSAKESGFMLPTPTAHNSKEGAYPAEYNRNTPTLATWVGGKIHPNFTEWMMRWPLDWTDLKPLGTAKFQSWRHQHSICSRDNRAFYEWREGLEW